jgi:hypothetical protein
MSDPPVMYDEGKEGAILTRKTPQKLNKILANRDVLVNPTQSRALIDEYRSLSYKPRPIVRDAPLGPPTARFGPQAGPFGPVSITGLTLNPTGKIAREKNP